jgi:predicted RNase H-like HicB family nuclease
LPHERAAETGKGTNGVDIRSISGAHTQGATLDELHANLKEVLALCLEELGDFLQI